MFLSFRFRLILQSAVIVVFCFTMIGVLGYNRIETVLLNNHVDLAVISYEQMYQNALLSVEWIENTVNQFKNDRSFLAALSSETYNFNLPNRLNSLSQINFDIIGVMAFSESGFNYSSGSIYGMPQKAALRDIPDFSEFIDGGASSQWFLIDSLPWGIRERLLSVPRTQEFLIYAVKIYDNYEYIGLLVLTVRTEAILSMFDDGGDVTVVRLGRYGELYTSPVVSVDRNFVSISQGFLDFNIVLRLSLERFYSQMQPLRLFLFISMILCLLILIFIYYKFTDRIFEALNSLNTQIKSYRRSS